MRESLGYPTAPETGAFAQITYEPFKHPKRGDILIRTASFTLPDGTEHTIRLSMDGARTIEEEARLTQGCRQILIPHQPH